MKPRKYRRLLYAFIVLSVLGGVYFTFNRIVDSQLRPLIENELTKSFQAPVVIESVRGGITGEVILNHVSLTVPGNPWQTRLLIERMDVNLDLYGLIIKKKEIESCLKSLTFIRPQVCLVHMAARPQISNSLIGINIIPAPPSSKTVNIPLLMVPAPRVEVKQGSFYMEADKDTRCLLKDADFLALSKDGKSWSLTLQAHSADSAVPGTFRFTGSLHQEDLKISGKAILEKWPLTSAGSVLRDLAGWQLTAGTLDAESPLVFKLSRGLWYMAKVTLNQATVAAPGPVGVVFSLVSGKAMVQAHEINLLGELRFNVGETPWKATGFIPLDNRPLAVQTSTDHFLLNGLFTDIFKLKNFKADGNGSAAVTITGTLQNPLMTGQALLGPSRLGNLQLDSMNVEGGYQNGNFNLEKAEGGLYDGHLSAKGVVGLTGAADAPVSLSADLTQINAKKLASSFGMEGLEGQANARVRAAGTWADPVFSVTNDMQLTRTVKNASVTYAIQNNVQLKGGVMDLVSTVNGKNKLAGRFVEKADAWHIDHLDIFLEKKGGHLAGSGDCPKDPDQPLEILVHGKDISLQALPFFKEQFPDVAGLVDLEGKVSGSRNKPQVSAGLSSKEVVLGKLEPGTLEAEIIWVPGDLFFKRLELGDLFSAAGHVGLQEDSPLDLKIRAKGIPVQTVAELVNWNTPPQPFDGLMSGKVHVVGVRKSPVLEGEGEVDSFQAGDWWADKVEGQLNLDQGKLQVQKLKMSQGKYSIFASGTWDVRSQPGAMDLRITADGFQLGKGPHLTGDFVWNAETGDPFWMNWKGTIGAKEMAIGALASPYRFTDFSMDASSKDWVLSGKVKIGQAVSGTALLDLSQSPLQLQALLDIKPVPLSEAPEFTQFLPPSLKVSGTLSGRIELKRGPLSELPISGLISLQDGAIQKYDFEKLSLSFSGNESRIVPILTLEREKAQYNLTGVLASPHAVWEPDCKLDLTGPFKNEKLAHILTLLGVDTTGHQLSGNVDGDLTITGLISHPLVGLSLSGTNLAFDDNTAPSAELHFSEADGKIFMEKSRITLPRGLIQIDDGTLALDPADPGLVVLSLDGSTTDIPISVFNWTSQLHLEGRLALKEKEGRPTFDGKLAVMEPGNTPPKISAFELAVQIHKKVIDFMPTGDSRPQLVGQLDLSRENKAVFNNIHLLNSAGNFSLDGALDLNGASHLVSDAGNIPIEGVEKWLFPKFPITGTGNYHLILDGTLDHPVFTGSFSISNGKAGGLDFDLFDGEIKALNDMLYLGSTEAPLRISRKDSFSFRVDGKMPLALTHETWLKSRNREMELNANMDQGDFSLILLAGLAKKASGAMDFSAHVTGTLDDPVLNMDLALNQCSMVPSMIAQSVDEISGRIKVRNNKLAVEDLNGRINQGRIFITSPPIEDSKMVLDHFIPQFLDLQLRTVGDHGLLLNIPTIMSKGNWGEIKFYGATPEAPLLIEGPITGPSVKGTALLDTGHYKFPPEPEVDEKGGKIEFKELANVDFTLDLVTGRDTWYSNDFMTQYLEVKVDPGQKITLVGKDSDSTPETAGIKCFGHPTSTQGTLTYLSHTFNIQNVWLDLAKDKLPYMHGEATERLTGVEIYSAGVSRLADLDVWVKFAGTFGNIDFTLGSNPPFNSLDKDAQQKVLNSYVMFNQDLTGLSHPATQESNPQGMNQVAANAAKSTLDRYVTNKASEFARPIVRDLLNAEVQITGDPFLAEGSGPLSLSGLSNVYGYKNPSLGESIGRMKITKTLNQKLSIESDVDFFQNTVTGGQGVAAGLGFKYSLTDKFSVSGTYGPNESNIPETKFLGTFSTSLPDLYSPKKGDKEPPHFLNFTVDSAGPGKHELQWETDKVTRCEIQVMDEDGQVVRDTVERGDFEYDHKLLVENLEPGKAYKVKIIARDQSLNVGTKEDKIAKETDD
jgi:hypothetical protein